MARIQFLAIVLGAALSAQATSLDVDVNAVGANLNLELSLDDTIALWENTWPKVAQYVPGITCVLGDAAAQKNTSTGELEGCAVIQNELSTHFPGVQCTGNLDEETLRKGLEVSAEVQVGTTELSLRRQDPGLSAAIDRADQEKDRQIDQKSRSALLTCAAAPHPGNCYTCVSGAAGAAIGSVGVCGAAAHVALKSSPTTSGLIFVALAACGLKAIGDLGNSISGCPLRVSYQFYISP